MAYILMADDQPEVLNKAAETLRAAGHRVVIVEDGQHAIDLLHDALPDVLVTDVMMPKQDGFQVLSALKLLDPTHSTRVVLLKVLGPTGEPWRDWGVPEIDSYVVKPASQWTLVIAVEQLLYRTLTTPLTVISTHRIEVLHSSLERYAMWHDDTLPPMGTIEEVRAAVSEPFHHLDDEIFVCPTSGEPYVTNPELSRKPLASIGFDRSLVTVYEPKASQDGTLAAGFIVRRGQAPTNLLWTVRRMSESEWLRVRLSL